ncbi:MAG: hypothetical protein ACLPQY_26545 [Streptosporangiaceae bacterium]
MVAIDAGISQHLDEALGFSSDPPAMGAHLIEIKEYPRRNPRIAPCKWPSGDDPGAAGTRRRPGAIMPWGGRNAS